MQKDENNAIRYLMKEMDPSEEMEFEKLMREDDNLLIEVESLRATNRKLSGLPSKNPPKHITENITDELRQIRSNSDRLSKNISYYFKRGLAAAVLLTSFTGGYLYYSSAPVDTQPMTSESSDQVQPWVDRNEVLRFQDEAQSSQTQDVQQDLNRSYERLQLVNDPSSANNTSGILLTGSPN